MWKRWWPVAVGGGISPAAAPSAQEVKKVVICLIIIVDTNFTDLYRCCLKSVH
jgi:hypothetical protein